MHSILSASFFLLFAGMANAMNSTVSAPVKVFVNSTVIPTEPISSPTHAPTFHPLSKNATTPVSAPLLNTSLPTAAPVSPPKTASLSPTMDFSEFPSLVPFLSFAPTITPSAAPVVTPTKRPSNGIIISSVNIIGLQLRLINAGALVDSDQWRIETEELYNGNLEDMTGLVSFVKSEVSEQNDKQFNTITFDLVLQSEWIVITNSMQYAMEPFQDTTANIQYGKALRTFPNMERLALPIPVPEVPKRTENEAKDGLFIFGDLNQNAILGIVVAGLLAVIYAAYRCNLWCSQRQVSKPSGEPKCTFRISADDDVSTIGPIDEDDGMDTEKGECFKKCNGASNSATTMKLGSSAKGRSNNGDESIEGELFTIIVPPGKLGIIIDTPDNGPPVIHAVKSTSVIRKQIHIGDKLIAIDDEDVRGMAAIQVSKIISSKSFNDQRKMTIVRPYAVVDVI